MRVQQPSAADLLDVAEDRAQPLARRLAYLDGLVGRKQAASSYSAKPWEITTEQRLRVERVTAELTGLLASSGEVVRCGVAYRAEGGKIVRRLSP